MAAMIDYVSKNPVEAAVYLSLKRDDYRRVWVAMKLKGLGYDVDHTG